MRKLSHVRGLVAAPFTPFAAGGELNLDPIPRLADRLVDDGVVGVFVCGSNGEGHAMTTVERMAVAQAWADAGRGRLRLMVHVGHASIAEARSLAAHAAAVGADAASATASFYFKPSSVANLVASMAQIAAAAPDLPFYYYHIPVLTGVALDMVGFVAEAAARIPSFAGLKYTATALHEYQACVAAAGGRFDVLFGYDELLLPALAVGARGAVGSTYNFAAPLYLEVMRAFEAGRIEAARERMGWLVELVRIVVSYPPLAAQKAVMTALGHEVGGCRLPLEALDPDRAGELMARLDGIGFRERLAAARAAAPA